MKDSVQEGIDFCEITFAIPAQQFGITCSLSTEEALPVVSEFVLRVIHACEAVTLRQLEEYFGFSSSEIATVIRALVEDRLLVWEEDSLEITPYARARFVDSPDSIPRFFRIKDYSADLVFDLMSFVPSLQSRDRVNRVDTLMELTPKDREQESQTKVEAERSFQEHFHRVYKGGRAEIYKISEVEPGERFYIPLSCRFAIDVKNGTQINRTLSDPSFDNRLEIASAITKALSASAICENPDLDRFETELKDPFLKAYLTGNDLEFTKYIENVHLRPLAKHELDTVPLLGSLDLAPNRALLLSKLEKSSGVGSDRAYWLAPQSRYWSRARGVKRLVRGVTGFLRKDTPTDVASDEQLQKALLKIIFQSQEADDAVLTQTYQNTLPSLFFSRGQVLGGRVELLLCPGRLMAALYHYAIEESPMTVPIGFLSSEPAYLDAAAKLFAETCNETAIYKLGSKGAKSLASYSELEFIAPRLLGVDMTIVQ